MEKDRIEKKEFFRKYLNIKNEATLGKLEQISSCGIVGNRDIIIREGEALQYVPFLVSGIVKGYSESEGDGKEHISCFGYLKGDIVVGISNLTINVKSLLTIEAIGMCEMIYVPVPELLNLIDESSEMMHLYNRELSLAYKKLMEHEDIVTNHRAKERYKYFVETYHDLVDVVSKKDIASYLHLSPESLSRVRKEYKEDQTDENGRM